jgi:hypothetical protein
MWAGPASATSRSENRAFMAQLRTWQAVWRWTSVTAGAPGPRRCNIGAPCSASCRRSVAEAVKFGSDMIVLLTEAGASWSWGRRRRRMRFGQSSGSCAGARRRPVHARFPTSTVALIRDIPRPQARVSSMYFCVYSESNIASSLRRAEWMIASAIDGGAGPPRADGVGNNSVATSCQTYRGDYIAASPYRIGRATWPGTCNLGSFLPLVHCFLVGGRHGVTWRDGRVAEGARLESVFTGNRNVGSNPTPSAKNGSPQPSSVRQIIQKS